LLRSFEVAHNYRLKGLAGELAGNHGAKAGRFLLGKYTIFIVYGKVFYVNFFLDNK
jgi:hypothetical protein